MLSLILPVHDEKELIKENIPLIYDYLRSLDIEFEILICDNGSTEYKQINFTKKEIRFKRTDERGLGLGIMLGIDNAKYENLMFYAIDLPFGLGIIKDSLEKLKDYDVVIGSKCHPDSTYNHSMKRKMFSKAYNLLINMFFSLGIKDTQGSLAFKRSKIEMYKSFLTARDAFLQTQILIYAKKFNHRIIEIPVEYKEPRKGTRIRPFHDGFHMLKQIIREKAR